MTHCVIGWRWITHLRQKKYSLLLLTFGVLGAGMMVYYLLKVKAALTVWAVYPNPSFQTYAEAQGWPVLARPADFVEEAKLA